MSDILGFSTYPTKLAIHGGQRRIRAFAEFYEKQGLRYESFCIFESAHYRAEHVGTHDVPLGEVETEFVNIPFINDLLSGTFAAQQRSVLDRCAGLISRIKPKALVLEQPFLWPLVKQLREDQRFREIALIYSSQNWEAPLKFEILVRSGVDESRARKVSQAIEDLERDLTEASDLVVAVSDSDADVYRKLPNVFRVVTVKNGVDRPFSIDTATARSEAFVKDRRYFFFVGSAYPPNVDGICELVFDGGAFFVPPAKAFAVCGGVAGGTLEDRRYQKFLAANSERVSFFQDIDDRELGYLKAHAHAILLPINFGGGSNLKTAEALASGKWVVATSTSMRGFEQFIGQPGVLIADDSAEFRKAMVKVWREPAFEPSAAARTLRSSVYWDQQFDDLKSAFDELDLIDTSTKAAYRKHT